MEKLEEAGIPVVAINYSACTVEEHTAATKILGEIFQVEDRAQEILDLYTAGHEGIAARTAEIQNKRRHSMSTTQIWIRTMSLDIVISHILFSEVT